MCIILREVESHEILERRNRPLLCKELRSCDSMLGQILVPIKLSIQLNPIYR